MKKIMLLAAMLLAAGCNRYDVEEILLIRDDISLTWKGIEQFVYEPSGCQLGFNAERKEFRAHTDNLSSWFVLSFSAIPTEEGDEIEADISWTGANDTRNMKSLEFQVKKASDDGMLWLWCKSAKIGVTIRIFK